MKKKKNILITRVSILLMIIALIFLNTANFWTYGFKNRLPALISASSSDEDGDTKANTPNPVEEKTTNGLQNISEYLHQHHLPFAHPESIHSFGNPHDIIRYPIQHLELITPPPKSVFFFS